MTTAHLPVPFDPDRAAEIAPLYTGAPTDWRAVIEGVAGCSPYLKSILERQSDWMIPALTQPETAIATLFAELRETPLEGLPKALRIAKARVAGVLGLLDAGNHWPLEKITGTLTDFADLSVDVAIKGLLAPEIARGKLPGMEPNDVSTAAGMCVLAMGKMGAHELNYSSDIDLICLFDESRFDPDTYHDARAVFIKVTRKMCAMLSDNTADGYVFRTDLRLRPDASVTPVCLSMEAAERYYESVGRTWERAAYIKARPCAGDLAAGERFLKALRPFVWRKHLDFAAIQDAHDMRLRIRAHKGLGGPITLPGHNMKLGRGGIREIEFFTQTRQLIAGGRDRDLRQRGTVEGLRALVAKGWVPEADADTLIAIYREHRKVEHRLQMIADGQTHDLPNTEDGFARLAAFLGQDVAELKALLEERFSTVHTLTEGFFAPKEAATEVDPDFGKAITARWPTYPALRSERGVEIFERLRPDILRRLQDAARPEEALNSFDGFLAGLPAGVQLFSLFEANPQLIDLLIDVAATSPALAKYLSRNSAVFDAVIGGAFFADWPGCDALATDLSDQIAAQPDYEAQLNTARLWQREWRFRIGVHHLRGLISAQETGGQYADLADACLKAVWPAVVAQFEAKHGAAPGRGAVVLGMGSLGARQLQAQSDLDLIVIYDAAGVEASDGRRPLAARPYYARLTQALVTAMTAPMADGRLYEVDMRLRPSGRQGPVATGFAAFKAYQRDEAWTWEHLALTRARAIAGRADLQTEIEAFRAQLLGDVGGRATVKADVQDMRARIADAKTPSGPFEAKLGAGRMQDIELTAQAAALVAGSTARETAAQLACGVAIGWWTDADVADLCDSYGLCWSVQAASKLVVEGAFDPQMSGEGARRFVLREAGAADMDALETELTVKAAQAAARIDATLEAK
ncbi:glutamine-synthetase adenylyltransferase [Cognatishimia sp. MH4019]|uniref:[protein-PII] uridylyltransferase family protein n=1 Tax=Cognatishimia sp. MH4019 TaxID=2854030 RepID=UPI001CD46E1C|nr:glutamine-synthetase adenylyltransferase [Cognatishimia sp. MH4019]